MSQAWGVLFSTQRRNLKKMRESLESQVELLSQQVVDALIQMIDSVTRLDKEIEALESVMKDQLSQDKCAQRIQSTLGIGFVGTLDFCQLMETLIDLRGQNHLPLTTVWCQTTNQRGITTG